MNPSDTRSAVPTEVVAAYERGRLWVGLRMLAPAVVLAALGLAGCIEALQWVALGLAGAGAFVSGRAGGGLRRAWAAGELAVLPVVAVLLLRPLMIPESCADNCGPWCALAGLIGGALAARVERKRGHEGGLALVPVLLYAVAVCLPLGVAGLGGVALAMGLGATVRGGVTARLG